MMFPDFSYEKNLWNQGYTIIGIDEVGRGCLAGPLYVGAVCFSNNSSIKDILKLGINDSKKLSILQRNELYQIIRTITPFVGTASVSTSIINKYGIVKATQQAIRQVLAQPVFQHVSNKFLLLDAFNVKYIKDIGLKNQLAIIHGDALSISIAAASIIAKVERDLYMEKLAKKYPHYKWDTNKGYGTKAHIEGLKLFGKTVYHRNLFIRKYYP